MRPASQLYYALLFLLSGISSLIYQVVWQRILQSYFGVSTLSITLIVAAYMCGLGLGYLLGGRLAQRVRTPLAIYGWIEILLGVFGALSPMLLLWIGRATAGSSLGFVFVISFLVLLTPTILMGATLPLLSQGFIQKIQTSGQVIGLFYGLNTLGAAVGALISAFVIIGMLGLAGTAYLAAFINGGIGLAALAAAQKTGKKEASTSQSGDTPKRTKLSRNWGYQKILAASFLVGFIGLGYEMVWVRVLGVLNKHTAYSFPTLLFFLLTGLAIGGYLFGKRADQSRRPTRLLWQVEIGAAILASLSILIYLIGMQIPAIRSYHQANFYVFQVPPPPLVTAGRDVVFSIQVALQEILKFLLPNLLIVLPASLLHGGSLVILDRISMDSPDLAGRRIGDVHLANIAGSLSGALLISLAFIPAIGAELTLKALLLVSLVFLALDLWPVKKETLYGNAWQPIAVYSGVLLALTLLLPWRTSLFGHIYTAGLGRPQTIREGRDSLIVLTWEDTHKTQPDELWLGGELHSVFGEPSRIYQLYALNCLSSIQPRSILIIGLGGGNTTNFYLQTPGVERVVIVELLDDLADFLQEHVHFVEDMLSDPRVTYLVDDGRRYLYANPHERFDLIAIDPLRHYTAGANNLYSEEAMTLYRDHLNPGGLFCAWMDEFHVIPRTAGNVFPYVDEFLNQILASNQPQQYSLPTLQQRAEQAGLEITPAEIYGLFKRDRQAILEREAHTKPLTDLEPQLEYYFFRPPPPRAPRTVPAAFERFLERIQGCDETCQAVINAP